MATGSGSSQRSRSRAHGAATVMLTVNDVKAAANFYQKAFGFAKRGIMNGPDGKPMHCGRNLRLRDTTLMLGPENAERGMRSAKTVGASPATLYLTSENVDQTVARAVKLGATAMGPCHGHGRVLGRSLRNDCGPRWQRLDGRDAHR